jgi:hypothetical protein
MACNVVLRTLIYFTNLVTETERAIKPLDGKLRNSYRFMAANKLKQILNSGNHHNSLQKRQLYIIKQLNHKLVKGNAIITQADKCKTVVIINSDEYSKKGHTFLAAKTSFCFPKILPSNIKNTYRKHCDNAT